MQVPGSANALMLGGAKDYTIARSVRLRSSATAYFSRTPGSTTNRSTMTFSDWVKRGALGASSRYLLGTVSAGNYQAGVYFDSSDLLYVSCSTGVGTYVDFTWYSAQVFRDPSAYYHIVVAIDTTQATAANRVKVYINGSQITANASSTYPAQNGILPFNQASQQMEIGSRGGLYFDGYLTDINFIDGQALTPSSFGEFDLTTGVWKPKKYAGTYGTNGFYLNFSDNSAATAAAIGKDYSGNGNNWTPNNISVTSGATYDSMTDVPTLTSATAANYAVMNPLFMAGTNGSLSNGNLTNTGGANPAKCFTSSIAVKGGGKFYAEFTATGGGNYCQFAVSDVNLFAYTGGGIKGSGNISYDTNSTGANYYVNSASATSSSVTITTNDIVMVAFDSVTRNVWFGKNGTWNESGNPASAASPTGAVAGDGDLAFVVRAESTTITANFGQRPFAYTPPTGFVALNTFNLPEPTIKLANQNFDATLYTGNGGTNTITNAAGFSPDLVWLKSRSAVGTHCLFDTIRGATNLIQSNATAAEVSGSDSLTAFNSNGFTLGADAVTRAGINGSGVSHVAWQWDAGSSTATNTAGSISAQVRANPSAGFSVVTFAVPSSATIGTVGHGLGVTPSMIIAKGRGAADNWVVWHKNATTNVDQYLRLNTTDAVLSSTNAWGSAVPNSTTFGLKAGTLLVASQNAVAYCFSEVAGYSKFGSYTGNGSADGTFVHLGFRPKYIIVKCTNDISHWTSVDSATNTYNVAVNSLYADTSAAENATIMDVDFLSNGFKLRGVLANECNVNGYTYIFMAFAENPTKYSLAR